MLSSRYVDPFEILEKIEVHGSLPFCLTTISYWSSNIFHIFMLRKYASDPSHVIEFGLL